MSFPERRQGVVELKPEPRTLNLGTMNYGSFPMIDRYQGQFARGGACGKRPSRQPNNPLPSRSSRPSRRHSGPPARLSEPGPPRFGNPRKNRPIRIRCRNHGDGREEAKTCGVVTALTGAAAGRPRAGISDAAGAADGAAGSMADDGGVERATAAGRDALGAAPLWPPSATASVIATPAAASTPAEAAAPDRKLISSMRA